jgi:WD40 repeat protein
VFDRASGRTDVGPVKVDPVADWVTGALTVSPDGALIAVGRNGGEVEIHDLATLRVLHELDDIVRDGENWVIDTSFSPQQPRLLAASTGDDTAVWDLSGDTPEVVISGRTGLTARFTPDGKLITSDQDGTLNVRDPTNFEILDAVEGLPQPATAPNFTRDGALMVTTDDFTNAARLWRVDGLDQIGGPIDASFGTIHPAGTAVVVGGDPVRHLTMDPDAWTRAACQTAGRNLTRDEWERYFANEEYRQTCPAQATPG